MAGIKIVDLPPLGRDLASTDLLELSLAGGTGSRKITGQEIMNASKLSINNTPIINGTVGRVLFQGTGDVLQQSSSLFWDNTNSRLGVGTSSPTNNLDVVGNARFSDKLTVVKSENTTFDGVSIQNLNSSNTAVFRAKDNSTGVCEFGLGGTTSIFPNDAFFYTNKQVLAFYANALERMRFASTGNLLINTTTDAGFRLDVNGTARVQGSATIQTLTVGLGAGSQSNNTVLGLSAFSSNTSGNFNVAIGPSALFNNTTGTGNIGIGHFSAVQISNGTNNVAIGREALSNGNSSGNVVVGMQACNTTTGNNNVVLGLQAQAGNFSNSIVIGNSAIGVGSNSVVLGNDLITTTILKGNVGIGTSSPSYLLHAIRNTPLGAELCIENLNTGINASSNFRFITNAGFTSIGMNGSNDTGIGSNRIYMYSGTGSSGISLRASQSTNDITMYTGGDTASNLRMRIFSTGNVGINTTTDAGYKLDVNGTARVITNGVLSGLYVNNTATFVNRTILVIGAGDGVSTTQGLQISANTSTGKSYINGWNDGGSNQYDIVIGGAGSRTQFGTDSASVDSAQVAINSTTRGFLPPRMTQAQRNAIASPAIGLEIYQTDATEGKYIYKSSGWTYIG